jgi:hypothetical protein
MKRGRLRRWAGQVTPLKNVRGGDHNTFINQNFNGVKDDDKFRRSTTQNRAQVMRMLSMAYGK